MVQDGTRFDLLCRHYPEPSATIANTSPIGRIYIGQVNASVLKE
jgi:hypothetical protein